MTVEDGKSLKDIFDHTNPPTLSWREIKEFTTIVSSNSVRKLENHEVVKLDKEKIQLNILVTGMPRWGKTTVLRKMESEYFSNKKMINIVYEKALSSKPENLRLDDSEAMSYNLAFALHGLLEMQQKNSCPEPQINIYDRGLIDHFVFAEALNSLYGDIPSYKEHVDAFKTLFSGFLGHLDGIIVCNSTSKSSIQRESTTPKELLNLLNEGYGNLPKSLSQITKGSETNPIIVISLDRKKISQPEVALEKAIFTLVDWNLKESVRIFPPVPRFSKSKL